MSTETHAESKKRRERSPSYPSIDLETAVQRLEVVYEKESRQPVPTSVIMEHWNYTPKSSYGLLAIAALLKYGLLEDQGSGADRLARITELGLSILMPESPEERFQAIQKAALNPAIISDIWTEYGGDLPSDASLKVFLIRQRSFNPRAVDDVIGVLRRTIEYANLSSDDKNNIKVDDDIGIQNKEQPFDFLMGSAWPLVDQKRDSDTLVQAKTTDIPEDAKGELVSRIIQIPLLEGRWAAFQSLFPMSESDWKQMIAVLDAMKPGLVQPTVRNTQEPAVTLDEDS